MKLVVISFDRLSFFFFFFQNESVAGLYDLFFY